MKNDDGEDLRAEVRQLALDHPSTDRHASSRTHIFYAPWMEPFGAKGFGNFPDEAFAQYRTSVEELVRTASKRDLHLWLEKFAALMHNERREREEVETAASVSPQIGMYTSQRMHDVIRDAVERLHYASLNACCEALLIQGLDRFQETEAKHGSAPITSTIERFGSAAIAHDAARWTIAVSTRTKARLVLFARAHDVKVPAIARAIFATSSELNGDAFAASPHVHLARDIRPPMSPELAAERFRSAATDCDQLRRTIQSAGGRVPSGSRLDRSLLDYERTAVALAEHRELDTRQLAEALRVRFVVNAALAAVRARVSGLGKALRFIHGEDVIIAGESGSPGKARNTMWEIVVAGLCARFAQNVELLDPPDLACTFNNERWAVECKMLTSRERDQHEKKIIEGAKQIQDYPHADRGLVLLNVTDVLSHGPWRDPGPFLHSQMSFVESVQSVGLALEREEFFGRLGSRDKVRSFVLFAQASLDDGEKLLLLTSALWPKGHAGPDAGEKDFIDAINASGRTLSTS